MSCNNPVLVSLFLLFKHISIRNTFTNILSLFGIKFVEKDICETLTEDYT